MPVKLREFYWNELLQAKDTESKVYDNALNKSNKQPSSRVSRK
jgi:hypothetical protein